MNDQSTASAQTLASTLGRLLAPAARPAPTDSEMAEAFRRLDLSDVPPRMRAWAAFVAGVRLGAGK